jgi:hypothetical protein
VALVILAICGPGSLVGIYWLGAIRGDHAETDRATAEQAHYDAEFAHLVTTLERQ